MKVTSSAITMSMWTARASSTYRSRFLSSSFEFVARSTMKPVACSTVRTYLQLQINNVPFVMAAQTTFKILGAWSTLRESQKCTSPIVNAGGFLIRGEPHQECFVKLASTTSLPSRKLSNRVVVINSSKSFHVSYAPLSPLPQLTLNMIDIFSLTVSPGSTHRAFGKSKIFFNLSIC